MKDAIIPILWIVLLILGIGYVTSQLLSSKKSEKQDLSGWYITEDLTKSDESISTKLLTSPDGKQRFLIVSRRSGVQSSHIRNKLQKPLRKPNETKHKDPLSKRFLL